MSLQMLHSDSASMTHAICWQFVVILESGVSNASVPGVPPWSALSDCSFLTPPSHSVSGQTPALGQAAMNVMIMFFALSRASHQVPAPS